MTDPRRIFVYGTLRRDLGYSDKGLGGEPLGLASVAGRLYHLGGFPGLIRPKPLIHSEPDCPRVSARLFCHRCGYPPTEAAHVDESDFIDQRTRGQVLDFTDQSDDEWARTLGRLDSYEGVPRLYIRDLADARLDDGGVTPAWLYIYNGRPDPDSVIPSGDWAEARGSRAR